MTRSGAIEVSSRIRNDPDTFFGKGVSESVVRNAEMALGLNFPESYVLFLREFGWCDIGGHSIFGLGSNDQERFDVVHNCLFERSDESFEPLPMHLLPIHDCGNGDLHCIDTSTSGGTVVLRPHDDPSSVSIAATDFSSFLGGLLRLSAED